MDFNNLLDPSLQRAMKSRFMQAQEMIPRNPDIPEPYSNSIPKEFRDQEDEQEKEMGLAPDPYIGPRELPPEYQGRYGPYGPDAQTWRRYKDIYPRNPIVSDLNPLPLEENLGPEFYLDKRTPEEFYRGTPQSKEIFDRGATITPKPGLI